MIDTRNPPDLSPPAVKVARRLQALPDDRTYIVVLTKVRGAWMLALLPNAAGAKVERVGKDIRQTIIPTPSE